MGGCGQDQAWVLPSVARCTTGQQPKHLPPGSSVGCDSATSPVTPHGYSSLSRHLQEGKIMEKWSREGGDVRKQRGVKGTRSLDLRKNVLALSLNRV